MFVAWTRSERLLPSEDQSLDDMSATQKVKVSAMPQAQADKLIGRVAQPLPRHYNGQGCAANMNNNALSGQCAKELHR